MQNVRALPFAKANRLRITSGPAVCGVCLSTSAGPLRVRLAVADRQLRELRNAPGASWDVVERWDVCGCPTPTAAESPTRMVYGIRWHLALRGSASEHLFEYKFH